MFIIYDLDLEMPQIPTFSFIHIIYPELVYYPIIFIIIYASFIVCGSLILTINVCWECIMYQVLILA